jgi:hypothetical protein
MNTEPFIYSEDYIRGRIYSFVKFKKYMKQVADIFCEEFHLNKNEVIGLDLTDDGKIVYLIFENGEIGFASDFLWDQNVRENFRKSFEVN